MRKFITAGMVIAMLAVPAASMAAPAKDTTVTTTTVGTCGGTQAGTVKVANGIATIGVPDNQAYGIIKAFPTNLKVKDIKTLSFKSNSSAGGGMVYMQVITNAADGSSERRIKYTPFDQVPEPGVGSWYTHNPMSSGVRYGTDINDAAPTTTWAEAVSALGNDTVNRVSITAGCAIGHGTVQVDRMQVNNSVIGF
jgi:hypothetical protein